MQGLSSGFRRYCAFRIAYRSETDLRQRLFAHLQRLHFAFHDEAQTGQLMARANTDIFQINQAVILIPLTIASSLTLVGVVTVMALQSVPLTLLSLGALPLLNIAAIAVQPEDAARHFELQEKLGDLTAVVEESVAGVRAVKGFGSERLQERQLDHEADAVRDRLARVRATPRRRSSRSSTSCPALALVAILWYGGHLVLDGELQLGYIVAFNSYVLMLIWPLRMAGMLVAQASRASAAAGRLDAILVTDPEVVDKPGARELPPGPGEIRFEHVALRLPRRPADLHRPRPPDPRAARRSRSSAPPAPARRPWPGSSRVSTTSTAGACCSTARTCATSRSHDLRRNVGIVFEDTFLFSDTGARQHRLRRPAGADGDRARRGAARGRRRVHRRHARRLRDVVGEYGYSLSGGQRQRLAIARAVLADPRVLILDDATSSVDPTKEHEIRAALREVMSGRTTLIIAHRPATIALADRVVLLDARARRGRGHPRRAARKLRALPRGARAGGRGRGGLHRGARAMRGGGGGGWGQHAIEETLSRHDATQVLRRLRPDAASVPLVASCSRSCCSSGRRRACWPARRWSGTASTTACARTTPARSTSSALLYLFAAIAGLFFGRAVIRMVAQVGETFLRDLRSRVFRHLMSLGMDFFEREKTGKLVARMTSDMDALQELVQMGLVMFVQNGLLFVGAILVIFLMSWKLALCTLVVVPPVVIASRWFRRASNKAYLLVRDRIGQNLSTLQEGLAGVRVVQAFGRERSFTRRFQETNEAQYDANIETVRISAKYFPIVEFAGVAGIAIIVGIGGAFVSADIVTVGTVAAFVLYLNNLFEPIQQLSQLYNTLQQAGAALQKLFELLDERPSIDEHPGAVDLPEEGGLELEHVSFGYGAEDVLHDVSLQRPAGGAAGARRPDGRRQVDAGQAHRPLLRPARGDRGVRRRRPARRDAAVAAGADRRRAPGGVPVRGDRPRQRDRRRSPTPPTTRSGTRSPPSASQTGSTPSPTGSTPKCGNVARVCRRGSGSSCRWSAPRSPTRRCWCSTRRRRVSTPGPSARSSAPSAA